jgi:hypothetical protein
VGGFVAVALAVVVGVAAPARPAQAGPLEDFFEDIGDALVDVVNSQPGNGGPSGPDPQLEAAKREIMAAVEASRREIQLHLDETSNGQVKACTEAALTKFAADIATLPPELLALFVNDAVNCATLSVEYFDVVRTVPLADSIGKLMGVIFAMAITGWTYYGLSPVDLLTDLIRGYEAVVARLKPTVCGLIHETYDPELPLPKRGDPVNYTVWCQAYDGGYGEAYVATVWPAGPTEADYDRARLVAGRNTAYTVAANALPDLRAALAGAGNG